MGESSRNEIRAALMDTQGAASGDGYLVSFGGACPVQGYGHIDGHFCYFRARHDSFRVEIYAEGADINEQNLVDKWCKENVRPIFVHEGGADNAGWQPRACSAAQIEAAVVEFRRAAKRSAETN